MKNAKIYYWILGACTAVQVLLMWFISNPERVEQLYSKGWYSIYSSLPKLFFGWIPFSVGDVFYVTVGAILLFFLWHLGVHLFRRQWSLAYLTLLKTLSFSFLLYLFFYISWGLNYYRQPLAISMSMPIDAIEREDYYAVLEKYIAETNALRQQLDPQQLSRKGVRQELEKLMEGSTPFDVMLSKSQIKGKSPLSSTVVSYFMVNGYFNPFTHEVHVNMNAPLIPYPFTTVHELAHQMGIGFEDECNFIAFRMLVNHDKLWYRYSAYYEAIQSLIRPVRVWDPEKYKEYLNLLDERVQGDLKAEREFWLKYHGVVDAITGPFYHVFLQHNNQPEGTGRYSMMNSLVVAWEISGREKL